MGWNSKDHWYVDAGHIFIAGLYCVLILTVIFLENSDLTDMKATRKIDYSF